MDNSGLVTLNFGMNVANSQGSASSQILHQLPGGIQQVFTQNAPIKSGDGTQNIVQQTVLPVNNSPQTGNPTVLAAPTGLQFVGQPGPGFLGPQQQQPQLLTQQAGSQQLLGPRSMYATNYQIMPRNFTVFNQAIQAPTGVAVQLSPQQIGGTTLSPMEQQQQFFQSAGFDSQLGGLQQQNQQQITFQNAANCQFMIQPPSQQLMLQSPTQQFTLPSPSQQFTVQNQSQFAVQGHNITQFNPQHHILTQGQGNNVIVQNQTGGMILQSDNFVSQGLSQNVFVPNPSIVQNVNPQVYGTAQNVLTNQIPGLISQAQVVANQNVGIISVSHSPENLGKTNMHNSGITNEQMQLLAHIANHGGDINNTNIPNQQNLVQQVTSQNQSLPSFGHFLLHHHMQSLPHPFLQNLSISTMATDEASRKQIAQSGITVSPPTNQSGLITVNISSSSGPTTFRNSTDNLNAEFNNWNIGQFVNQAGINQNVASNLNTQLTKGADVNISVQTLCSSKLSNSVQTSQVVATTTNVLSKGITSLKVCANEEFSGVRTVSMGIDCMKSSHVQLEKSAQTVVTSTLGSSGRNTIVVPYGWVRALEGESIVYYSPTCTRLTSTDNVKQYLVADGTCKCGLDCPLHVDRVFNFNSDVISIKWSPSFSNIKDAGNPCNHKRKYSAMSSSQSMRSFVMTRPEVSMVTSSGLMSPRVSSTVQETQALIDGNKRRKVIHDEKVVQDTKVVGNDNLLTSNANSATVDLTNNIKELSDSCSDVVTVNCDTVKHSDKHVPDVTDDVVSTSVLTCNNNVTETSACDKLVSPPARKGKSDKIKHSETSETGRVFLKDISRSIPKQLVVADMSCSKKSEILPCSNHGNTTSSNHGNIASSNHGNITSNHGNLTKSNHGNLTSSNHGNLTSSNHGNITSSNHGNITSSNHGNITSSNHGNITSSYHGNITSSNHGNLTSSNHGNIASSNHGNKKIDMICSRLGSGINVTVSSKVGSISSMTSPTHSKTDSKLLSPKSLSRPSSRSSTHSRHSADTISPRSDRNVPSTKHIDRLLTSGRDQRLTAEMFTHFMNFCGLTGSNIPPMLPQNIVEMPGSVTLGKDSLQTGLPLINDSIRSDLMKLPMMPQSPFGPLQANILANLHKLTSPPNQQVFPTFNLPGLSNKHPSAFHHDSKTGQLAGSHGPSVRPGPVGSSSISVTTPGLTSPSMPDILVPSPSKRARGKKGSTTKVESSKNIESLFDSDEPPPNVDVSQLKDKGHGPIPKEKIASFIEDSSEFTKQQQQQSDLMSKSISSTTSSPVNECTLSKEACPVDSQSEKTRSDSACSDRLNSPCQMDREVVDITDDVLASESLPTVNTSVLTKDSISASITSVTNSGTKACVSLIHQLSTSTPAVQSMPVASAPPTPTTVVHHTPGSLSCHQMSLIKARQHALGLKDGMKDPSTENLLHPLAAILSDPTIGQVFQQMFPEVAQQVLMQTFDLHNKSNTPDISIDLATGLKIKKPTVIPTVPGHCPTSSTTPVSVMLNVPYEKHGYPMQPIVSNISQGEFPASTLLSAAAKAQLDYQQNQFGILMAQQLRGSVPTALLPQLIPPRTLHNIIHSSTVNPVLGTSMTTPFVTVSKQGSVPVTSLKFTSQDTPITSTTVVNEKMKPRVGAQKISELLNRNKPSGHQDVEMTNLIHLLQKPQSSHTHGNDITKLTHMLQGSQVPVTTLSSQTNIPLNMSTPGSLVAPLGHLIGHGHSVDVPAVNPHLVHMYNSLGIPVPINCELMTQKPLVRPAGPPVDSTMQRTSMNQFVSPTGQPGTQFTCNVSGSAGTQFNVSGSAGSIPLLVPQADLGTSGMIQNTQQFVPVLDAAQGTNQMFNLPGIQPANVQGLLQPTQFSVPTASLPTMSVASDGGVIGRQLNQGVTVPTTDTTHTGNQVLISNNLPGSSASTPDVINLLNMHHTIGSGTHLTAMQLQTLQLQQQLLEQLQQVQGMQHLISQYNLQNVTNTPPSTLKKESVLPVPASDTASTTVIASTNSVTPPVANTLHSTSSTLGNSQTTANDSNVTEPDSKKSSPVTDGVTSLRKSCNVRVIAAADTTEDCSTKTADIGTETDAFVEDNSESDPDETAMSEGNTTSKSDDEVEHDISCDMSDICEEKVDTCTNVTMETQDVKTFSPVLGSVGRKTSVNTCLAIATQKGNSRSSEIESRVFGEKSSLARSQNLSAELTKPVGGELKLRIKRKHLLHTEGMHDVHIGQTKRIRMKERKSQSYLIVKKALRSSTMAATKASTSLAAKYMSKDKLKEFVKRTVRPSTEIGAKTSMATMSSIKSCPVLPTSSSESYECDSSIDSQSGSMTETEDRETCEKDSITSRIAAALSSQKGLWQLTNQKKGEEETVSKASCSSTLIETGRKRTRLEDEVEEDGSEVVPEKSPAVSCSFHTGDLVWGQIRGFPSWPGKLVVDTELKSGETLEEGKVLVRWFGDNTITQVEPNKLKTLSEGLEAHHRARKKHRRGRKMNSNLEQAIQHAMTELDRQTASTDSQSKTSSVTDVVVKSTVKVKQKK